MKTKWFVVPGMLIGTMVLQYMAAVLSAEPPADQRGGAEGKKSSKVARKVEEQNRVSVEVARDRAKLMHDIYETTLDVMHHRYFHREKAVVPARAMEDVFSAIKRQSDVEARWISVNLKAMGVDHEPESEFEKQAAKEIADGKSELDVVEDGYYRRAGAIPLSAGCVSCHSGFFKDATQTPKYAALVISVPVKPDAGESK